MILIDRQIVSTVILGINLKLILAFRKKIKRKLKQVLWLVFVLKICCERRNKKKTYPAMTNHAIHVKTDSLFEKFIPNHTKIWIRLMYCIDLYISLQFLNVFGEYNDIFSNKFPWEFIVEIWTFKKTLYYIRISENKFFI